MMMPPGSIALDFETYSATDLKKHGLRRYLDDPHFTVLLAGVHSELGGGIYDFVDPSAGPSLSKFREIIEKASYIFAHNAEFEYQVLLKMGIEFDPSKIVDTAAMSRCWGGSSSLGSAARQFLDSTVKMDEGLSLIRKFCMPSKTQQSMDVLQFIALIISTEWDDWQLFKKYCYQDTVVCWELAKALPHLYEEARLDGPTYQMNRVGWHVDLEMVEEMQRRYLSNLFRIEADFRLDVKDDPTRPLNLNSHAQLKAWCLERGVKAKSFDREAVAALLPRIQKKLNTLTAADPKFHPLAEVECLLNTKQELGGSSLKKLQTIIDTTSGDGRLHNQYIHAGAVQSWRTTGVGVQMQNLKRIGGEAEDMTELQDIMVEWSNDKLARSLRQVFTSSSPQGQLIVGDFSSVESRALAYLADETWKLDAYKDGKDLYKVQAAAIYNMRYEDVTKEQRQTGKLGELSCGYGAGRKAVTKFAKNLGIEMTEDEAGDLVTAWRDANPRIVDLWSHLEDGLRGAINTGGHVVRLAAGLLTLEFTRTATPKWIADKTKDKARTIQMKVRGTGFEMVRLFHGVHLRGNDITYFKPSSGKTGDPWSTFYRDPDTHQAVFYTLYGGKLAGILTQSLCRELFMHSLKKMTTWARGYSNLQIIGQFHDEIVMDWVPGPIQSDTSSLEYAKALMERAMSQCNLPGFPLEADIKSDYRYTK